MRSTADPQTRATGLLRRASIRIAEGDADKLVLVLPARRALTVTPRMESRSPGRGRIASAAAEVAPNRVLYLVSTPGIALAEAATEGVVDLVSTDPEQVIIEGKTYLEGPRPSSVQKYRTRAKWGRWAVERVLVLSATPMTQGDLAAATGITQQGVSKILRGHPYATATSGELNLGAPPDLLDRWARDYPGVGGIETGWYHLDPVTEQTRLALDIAKELEVRALATGDVAADTYAAWRLPTTAALYIAEAIDFSVADFVPADPGDSTLTARIPQDPTLWHVAGWYSAQSQKSGSMLADPALVYWDLLHAPGPDAADAAGALRDAITGGQLRV